MKRLSNDEIFLGQAMLAGAGSTCHRRMVGCVLTNKFNHVTAVGRNGVPSGMPHCIEVKCAGADAPSGSGLDLCLSPHAEQSALAQCRDVMAIETCYVVASPCVMCIKQLMNTSCRRIVFFEEYTHPESKHLWLNYPPKHFSEPRTWETLQTQLLTEIWSRLKMERALG